MPSPDISVCLYPNGMAVVSERCLLSPKVGYSTFEYGPVPPEIDVSSFRCVFDDPDMIRLRDYHISRPHPSKHVMMGIDAVTADPRPCTIVYQTAGFHWQVWYDCILTQQTATLAAWIAVSNSTPLTYSNIELRFVCDSPSGRRDEQHLFTTERQVGLGGMDVSHIELVTVPGIPLLSRLVAPADDAGVYEDIYIRNSDEYGLGLDLPSGPIRIYENRPWPVHTDSGHLPVNTTGDDISLRSFPIGDVSIYGGWNYDTGMADLYVRNDRDYQVVVQVEETERKDDIVEATHTMIEADAIRYFPVTVDPDTTSHLRYRVSANVLVRGRPPGYGMQTSPALTMLPVGSHLPRQSIQA